MTPYSYTVTPGIWSIVSVTMAQIVFSSPLRCFVLLCHDVTITSPWGQVRFEEWQRHLRLCSHPWQTGFRHTAVSYHYLIISWHLHVWNGVAVAAYSRFASRSQAKFLTMKLSPLSTPRAAAPAQSTLSPCRSLDFRRVTSSQPGRWVGSWPLLLLSIHEDTS